MSVEALREGLTSADAEVRRRAVASAAERDTEELQLVLVDALGDADWRVRGEAAAALSRLRTHPSVSERLVRVLLEESDVGFRNAAMDVLGKQGERGVAAIVARLDELDADGRKLAAEGLAKTAKASALSPLAQLARDPDVNVQAAAVEAVGEVGRLDEEAALPIIDHALSSEHEFVRLAALEGIERLGLTIPWRILQKLLDEPPLVATGLLLAADMDEPRAAAYFVERLNHCGGQSWLKVVAATCNYAEHSAENRAACRAALEGLAEAAVARLEEVAKGGGEHAAEALLVLCLRGGAAAADATVQLVGHDEHAQLVQRCIRILGAGALDALNRCLLSSDTEVRSDTIDLMADVAEDETLRSNVLQLLRPNASDASPLVVRAWLRAVTRFGDLADFRIVFEQLGATTQFETWRLVVPAIEAGTRRHWQEARELALTVAPSSAHAAAAAIVIRVAPEPLGGSLEADLEWLTAALSNESPTARMAAIEALATLEHDSAVEALAFSLTDDEPAVRMSAVRALGMVATAGNSAAQARLLGLSRSSSNVGFVVAALQALGASGDPEVLSKLEPLIESEEAWRASAAVLALSGFAPTVRRPALQRALLHPAPEVVKSALELMDAAPDTVDDIAACLQHSVWDVRRTAADRLATSGSERAGSALKERLADEPEPLVAAAIHRSLGQLAASKAINWSMLPPESGREE